jgi:hypothetical protein
MNWRYGELSFFDKRGQPLDAPPTDFRLRAWQAWFPWDGSRASTLMTSSHDLDRVWNLNQNSVKTLTIDLYTDSNARQRSPDCQADAAVAAQVNLNFNPTSPLHLPFFSSLVLLLVFSLALIVLLVLVLLVLLLTTTTTHRQTDRHTHTHTRARAHTHAHTHTHTHAHTRTRTHTHTHTHTHTTVHFLFCGTGPVRNVG